MRIQRRRGWMGKNGLPRLCYSVLSTQYLVPAAALAFLSAWCGATLAQVQQDRPKTESKAVSDPVQEPLLRKLSGDDASAVREAAEALAKSPPKDREKLEKAAEAVKAALGATRDAAAERSLRLALGKLAAAG